MPPQSKVQDIKLTASAALLRVKQTSKLLISSFSSSTTIPEEDSEESNTKYLYADYQKLIALKIRERPKLFTTFYNNTTSKIDSDSEQEEPQKPQKNTTEKNADQSKEDSSGHDVKHLITLASTSVKDDEACKAIINALSESEIETAARSSYEYFKYALPDPIHSGTNRTAVDDNIRKMYAMKMAKRHLIAEKRDTKAAIEKMKSTIKFREEMNIDTMRQCFYNLNNDEESNNVMLETRKGLEKELSDGKHIVRGHDLGQHAFLLIFPRNYTSFDVDWYLKGKLFSLERAIAYTERISGGKVEKVNVVFDYKGYVSEKHDPPLSLIKELLYCLRDHYPERLQHMFFVDAPLRFRAFWALVKPFIDPDTKRKIKFVSGSTQKQAVFNSLVLPEQSMSFMHTKGIKPDDFDIEKWVFMVPFDHDVDGSHE